MRFMWRFTCISCHVLKCTCCRRLANEKLKSEEWHVACLRLLQIGYVPYETVCHTRLSVITLSVCRHATINRHNWASTHKPNTKKLCRVGMPTRKHHLPDRHDDLHQFDEDTQHMCITVFKTSARTDDSKLQQHHRNIISGHKMRARER